MKAKLIITDDRGRTFSGEIVLVTETTTKKGTRPRKEAGEIAPAQLDFDLPDRAFIKRYSKGLGGSKKFVLLMAFMTKGETEKEVRAADIERLWNRMTAPGLLGYRFNRRYPSTAREEGWVSMKTKGVYALRSAWKDIFIPEAGA